MGRIAESLSKAVKKLAYSTSVDQLKRRGVDKVRVLGIDRIAFLIQEAVNRSLRHKMLSLEREQLASATREEFLKLLQSNQDLTRSHDQLRRMKEEAEGQVDQLRRELGQQSAQLKKKLMLAESEARARFVGEDAAIAERIAELFAGVQSLPDDVALEQLRGHVLELVLEIVNEERRTAIAAREVARNRDVDLMQRRIAKLQVTLHETEHQLREVVRVKSLDDGISSMYREVQGLDKADMQFERKLELMHHIYQANAALQKGMRT